MIDRVRFPLRLRILIAVLFVITAVVGTITFTMASLFHKDKTAYIHDLTSVMAGRTAHETRALFEGYTARLKMYALILGDDEVNKEKRARKIKSLFSDFSDFVAVTIYDDKGKPKSTVFDESSLTAEGITKANLFAYRDSLEFASAGLASGEMSLEAVEIGSFPCLRLNIVESGEDGELVVVSAILQVTSLQKLTQRSDVFEAFVLDSDGRFLIRAQSSAEKDLQNATIGALAEEASEINASITKEFSMEGREMIGGFAPVNFEGIVAGVQIPKSAAYMAGRELQRTMVFLSLALLVSSALASIYWSRRITKPIEDLSGAAQTVGRGDFDVEVEISSRDEIGLLGNSFNQMTAELKSREEALNDAQKQLIQSEKMAAFGQLGAGIAHEVKNPLAGILGCAQLSLLTAEEGSENEENLKVIEKETRRCRDIIDNLLKFARQEKAEQTLVSLELVIEDSVAIVSHQLGVNGVRLEKEIEPDLQSISGNANQLQQVLMNLLINAQQAMGEGGGKIKISAENVGKRIVLKVEDNGPGIPKENIDRIFEPFFTTKRSGKGTGLGLSVSYGIVTDHKGRIDIESEEGKGTTFVLTFPSSKNRVAVPDKLLSA